MSIRGRLTPTVHAVRIGMLHDRAWLAGLPITVAAVTAVLVPSYSTTYATEEDLARAVASARGAKTQLFLYGELDPDAGVGRLAVWELGALTCLALAVVVALRVIACSRGEEDAGRTEILHAWTAGPFTRLAGQALVMTCLCLSLGVGAGVGMLALDESGPADAASYGAAVSATCLLVAMTILVVCQLMADAPAARGAGLLLLGLMFVGHGLGAARDWAWAGWASPLRLRTLINPGGDNNWWPFLWAAVASSGLALTAGALARRRDLGLPLVSLRAPWSAGSVHVTGPRTFAARLCLWGCASWAVVSCLMVWLLITMGEEIVDLARQGAMNGDGALGSLLSGEDPGAAFLDYVGALAGALAACQAVALVCRCGLDERAGRLEAVISTGVQPWRALLSWWQTAALATAVSLLSAALVAGLVGDSALGTSAWQAVRAVAGQWPAVLAAGGLTCALCGLAPGARGLAWAPVLIGLGITQLGTALDLPRRVLDAAPFVQAGHAGSLWLLALAALGTAVGVIGINRRDMALGPAYGSRGRIEQRS